MGEPCAKLGWPTKRALGLASVPKFYQHDDAVIGSRRARYIESVYEAINEAGSSAATAAADGGDPSSTSTQLDEAGTAEMVAEATASFRMNAAIYVEVRGGGRATVHTCT